MARRRCTLLRFSRPPHSTALPPLQGTIEARRSFYEARPGSVCPASQRHRTNSRSPPYLPELDHPRTRPTTVQRLLALTLGIYLNTLTGRPPRALAAYDGRQTHTKPLVVVNSPAAHCSTPESAVSARGFPYQ
jgi:hypothetical protein